MTNAELIKALRYCSDNEKEEGCDECPHLHIIAQAKTIVPATERSET